MHAPWEDIARALLSADWLTLIDVLQGLLTPLIAVLVAYVAWQQMRTNRNRLRLELYEKRYQVYQALVDLFLQIVTTAHLSREDVHRFEIKTSESYFLFDDPELTEYLADIKTKAWEFYLLDQEATDALPQLSEDGRLEYAQKLKTLIDPFREQLFESRHLFAKHLRIQH